MSVVRRALEQRSAVDQAIADGTYGQPGYGNWLPGMVWGPSGTTGGVIGAGQLSAVYAAWRLLSDAIGTLPLDAFTRSDGARQAVDLPAYLRFLSPGISRIDYLVQVVLSLLTDGNAFIATPRDVLGVPTALVPLDPSLVEVSVTKGVKSFTVNGKTYDEFDILHIAGMMLPGSVRGMSPITYARQVIDGAVKAQEFGTRFFHNSAVPPAVIQIPLPPSGAVSEEDGVKARRIAKTWHDTNGGSSNAGKVGVLLGGATLNSVAVSPEDAQWLDTRRFGVQEIARIYGVPPHLLADSSGSTSWGSGLAEQNLAFGQFSLLPWTTRIEHGHDRLLASHGETSTFLRLNLDARLRASLKDRYASYQIGIAASFMSRNEARRLEDLPPVEGGDELLAAPVGAGPANLQRDPNMTPEELATALQKIYLSVGSVIDAEEARAILNRAGADLTGPAPAGGTT